MSQINTSLPDPKPLISFTPLFATLMTHRATIFPAVAVARANDAVAAASAASATKKVSDFYRDNYQ